MQPDRIPSLLAPHLSQAAVRSLMVELAKVPSPQTDLFEAEPLLRKFIEDRGCAAGAADGVSGHPLRRDGKPDRDVWHEPQRRVADALQQRHEPAPGHDEKRLFGRCDRWPAARIARRSRHGQGAERTEGHHGRDAARDGCRHPQRRADRRAAGVPVLRIGRDRPPRRDPQRGRDRGRARRRVPARRQRQPHQPRQPRPHRRIHHRRRCAVARIEAPRRLQRHHRRARGASLSAAGHPAVGVTSAARPSDADHQSHSQLSQIRRTPSRIVANSLSTADCCPTTIPTRRSSRFARSP